jgi:hypothetical protein
MLYFFDLSSATKTVDNLIWVFHNERMLNVGKSVLSNREGSRIRYRSL